MFWLAVTPFIIFTGMLFWGKNELLRTAIVTLVITVILVVTGWKMQPDFVLYSVVKGIFVAVDILLIVWGALYFLDVLKQTKIINHLCAYLETVSKDYRVQVILLAWFLENFLEGTAGFGTPSTVVAPLLAGIGLSPLLAAAVSLVGNSTSVAFGAAGTPVRVGFAGINAAGVPEYAVLLNLVGFLVPTFMLWLITRGREESGKQFQEALPFAVWTGIAFVVPAALMLVLGQEFPSILGSIAGLVMVVGMLKWWKPGKIRQIEREELPREKLPIKEVLGPYLILVGLLVAGKFLLGSTGIQITWGIKHNFAFYNPGWAFLICGITVSRIWIYRGTKVQASLVSALKSAIGPFLVIASMSALVQLMIYSGKNDSGWPSMINILADASRTRWLPMAAPVFGAFGSFITGSATVSNIMFGELLASASAAIGMSTAWILALQLVGGAAGNMIALADILPAQTVLGLKGQERAIIGKVIVPCVIYIALVGILGMVFLPK